MILCEVICFCFFIKNVFNDKKKKQFCCWQSDKDNFEWIQTFIHFFFLRISHLIGLHKVKANGEATKANISWIV